MTFDRSIGNSHAEEEQSIRHCQAVLNMGRLMAAINEKGKVCDKEYIDNRIKYLKEQTRKVNYQKEQLEKKGPVFIKSWATDYNTYFVDEGGYLKVVISGPKGIKDILRTFCPRVKTKGQSQAIDYSALSRGEYQLSLFNFDSFPPCVEELYKAMVDYYKAIEDCRLYCDSVNEKEQLWKADRDLSLESWEEYKKESEKKQMVSIRIVTHNADARKAFINDEALNPPPDNKNHIIHVFSSMSVYDFAQKKYHESNTLEADTLVFYLKVHQIESEGPSSAILKDIGIKDKQQREETLYIIRHIDEMLQNVSCRDNKIPASFLSVLFEWSGANYITKFLRIVKDEYKGAGGTLDVPGSSAISNARKSSQYQTMKAKFIGMIQSLLPNRADNHKS